MTSTPLQTDQFESRDPVSHSAVSVHRVRHETAHPQQERIPAQPSPCRRRPLRRFDHPPDRASRDRCQHPRRVGRRQRPDRPWRALLRRVGRPVRARRRPPRHQARGAVPRTVASRRGGALCAGPVGADAGGHHGADAAARSDPVHRSGSRQWGPRPAVAQHHQLRQRRPAEQPDHRGAAAGDRQCRADARRGGAHGVSQHRVHRTDHRGSERRQHRHVATGDRVRG